MKIYNYDPVDGSLLNEANADPSPLVPGEFLIPAHATIVAPPEFNENEIPVFSSGAWSVVPDFRNTTYWLSKGEEFTIANVDDIPPEEAIFEKVSPPVYPDKDTAISAMISWINEVTLSITGNYPIDEKLAWSDKEAAALAFIASTATASQANMLQNEANLTGETVSALALVIKAKAEAYKNIIGLVSGLRRKTEAAIAVEAAKDDPDPYQYEDILLQAKAEALPLLAEI